MVCDSMLRHKKGHSQKEGIFKHSWLSTCLIKDIRNKICPGLFKRADGQE
jgi:hypothetical protein